MRILYSHYLTDDAHPAVRMVHAIARELGAAGHEVRVHRSAGPPGDASANGGNGSAPANRLVRTLKAPFWFLKALARNRRAYRNDCAALRDFRPEVVLARQDAYCFSMPLAAGHLGVPLVTYADAPVAYETRLFPAEGRWHPPGLVETVERWGLRRSRAVVAVSSPCATRVGRYPDVPPIHVVPNGVDPVRFPTLTPDERLRLRHEYGLGDGVVIGFLGTFRPFHGIDRLRELMLATAGWEGVRWLLLGDGPGRAALESAVRGRVPAVFVGRRPDPELGRLVGLMDVAVAPHAPIAGDFYFCPLKILEYAAAGCAVLAADQGDIPRLLGDGAAGVVIPPEPLAVWVQALRRLVEDPRRRAALGWFARDWVLSRFTWRHTAERVARVLEGAVAQETTRPESVCVPAGAAGRE